MQHRIRIARVRTIVWLAILATIPALPGTAIAQTTPAPETGAFTLTPRLLADASWHGRPIQRPFARRSTVSDRAARLRPGAGYRLTNGSRRVRTLQQRLTRLGYRPGPSDGLYGPRTQAAVLAFQRKHGLPQTGAAGPATLRILQRRTTPQAGPPQPAPTTQPAPSRPPAPPLTPARTSDGGIPALLVVLLALLAVPLVLLTGLLLRDRRRAALQLPVQRITPWQLDPPREPDQLPQGQGEPQPEQPRIRRVPPPRHVPSQERRQALRQRILAMRAEGMTLQEIADLLTAEGEITPGGGRRWQPWSVRAATRPIAPGRSPVPQRRR